MTQGKDTAMAATGRPVVFDSPAGSCFGWFHAARGEHRDTGVLLCRPLGYEAMCSYLSYNCLAQALADAGFDVLRFDYHGTGDSAGSDEDADRVAAWLGSVQSALAELKRLAGVTHLSLFGLRMGATLAAQVASQHGGVDSLVMWAPCPSGRAFARELLATGHPLPPPAGAVDGPRDLEALGFLYTAQTLHDLTALDCMHLPAAPAKRVLVIARDDMPADARLAAKFDAMGAATTSIVAPGYAAMMVAEPHAAKIEHATLDHIVRWLCTAHPLQVTGATQQVRPTEMPSNGYLVDGVMERPVAFGPAQSLFGLLAESADSLRTDARAETAFVMINVGGNYHIGPNRFYVRLARTLAAAGYRALRVDLQGIGDSPSASGSPGGRLYSKESSADVRAAVDWLATLGCKNFYLVGVCSGSFVAFQSALADARVTGQVLMNSRLLDRQDGEEDMAWENAMQRHYKSIDFYGRALFDYRIYPRFVRGEIDLAGIASRVATVVGARIKRAFARVFNRVPRDSVLGKARQLSARGVDTLMVVAAEDDGRDYVEFHFGRRGRLMRGDPNFRMLVVDDCDHTFSSIRSQQFVIAALQQHVEQRQQREAPAGRTVAPAVPTPA